MKKNKKKWIHLSQKERIVMVLIYCFYAIGLILLAYPVVSNQVHRHAQKKAAQEYLVQAEKKQKDLAEEQKEREKYNQELAEKLKDEPIDYAVEAEKNLLTSQNLAQQKELGPVQGIVEIPKINIELPVYDGTNEVQISSGAGLMEGTSLLGGGAGTHSVLTSHRGLPSARLFTDLGKIEKGDRFFIKVGSEQLAYEVDQIRVIDPSDFSLLKIVDGKDYVTLLTCTPYMVNTHRLLVRGKRITPYTEAIYQEEAKKGKVQGFKRVLSYLLILLLIILSFYLIKRLLQKIGFLPTPPLRKRKKKVSQRWKPSLLIIRKKKETRKPRTQKSAEEKEKSQGKKKKKRRRRKRKKVEKAI